MSLFVERLRRRAAQGEVLLLDGAYDTTIRARLSHDGELRDSLETPIRAVSLFRDAPQVIYDVTLAFANAGAEYLTTANYQAHLSAVVEALHVSPAEGAAILRRGPALTRKAADDHARAHYHEQGQVNLDQEERRPLVALSLSSFGATLDGAREYCGLYPPPFGPVSPDFSVDAQRPAWHGQIPNSYPDDEAGRAQDAQAEQHLARWHLERLRVYAEDSATSQSIDVLAFETVPLLREVRAIRAAVAQLEQETGKIWPFLVHTVIQGGLERGADLSDVVAAQLAFNPPKAIAGTRYARPLGLAINCTATWRVPAMIPELAAGIRALRLLEVPLVIRPNRSFEESPEKSSVEAWTATMEQIVSLARAEGVFMLAIGGCCGTDPDCIGRLKARLARN